MKITHLFVTSILGLSLLFVVAAPAAGAIDIPTRQTITAGDKFYRTELYFGMNKPGGGEVTDEEWSNFLSEEVTPKFPDGFTVVEGYGQWRDKEGKIVR